MTDTAAFATPQQLHLIVVLLFAVRRSSHVVVLPNFAIFDCAGR